MKIFRPILLGICLLLSACMADISSRKLSTESSPIKDLTVAFVTSGNLSATNVTGAQQHLMNNSFKQITATMLNNNGVHTEGVYVSGINLYTTNFAKITKDSSTSHVLIFQPSRVFSQNTNPYLIEFEASLVDKKAEKIIWKSTPSWGLCTKDCEIQTRRMFVSVIKVLNKDGFITLKDNKIVDENNKEF